MALLEGVIANLNSRVIPGEAVFKLYDTYGFPVDLTADIARERSLSIDEEGFNAAMSAQRARARAASRFGVDLRETTDVDDCTEFAGYQTLEGEGAVAALLDGEGARVQELRERRGGKPRDAVSGPRTDDCGMKRT